MAAYLLRDLSLSPFGFTQPLLFGKLGLSLTKLCFQIQPHLFFPFHVFSKVVDGLFGLYQLLVGLVVRQ